MRVVTEQGMLGAEQGWTKACNAGEQDSGQCYDVKVVHAVDGSGVRGEVLARLRSGDNSAERSLVCG